MAQSKLYRFLVIRPLVVTILLAALFSALTALAVLAQARPPLEPVWSPEIEAFSDPVLRVSPASSAVYTRDTFVVEVVVDDTADLGAYDFTLLYDPAVLYVQNVTLGSFLRSTGNPVTWWTNDYSWAAGVQVHAYAQGSNPGPSGTGTLVRIQFWAEAAGSSSLTVGGAELRDMADNVLGPLTTIPGTVTVTDPQGVLSGTVRYEDGTPASNIRVTAALAQEPGNVQWWVWTAADGSFSIPGSGQPPLICNHSYRVTLDPATVPLAYTWTPLATLLGWCYSTLSFQLIALSPPPPAESEICDAPTLIQPTSTTVTCGTEVELSWAGDCDEYNVEYEYWSGEGRQSSGWIQDTSFSFVPPYYERRGDTLLWWHVRGRDAQGAETAWSAPGLVRVKPAPPRNVRAEALSCDQIAVHWDESTCYPCVMYAADCRASDGSWGSCRLDAPATECTVAKLNMSTTYSCTVTCVGKSDTATSDVVTATTLGVKTEQEAEDGAIAAPMEVAADPEASGGEYAYSPVSFAGSTTLKLCVPDAGAYEVWGRVRGLGWGADTFVVTVDGGAQALWEVPIGEWAWAPVSHRDDSIKTVQVYHFSAGGHSILVEAREALAQLDIVELRAVPTPTPSPTPTATQRPTQTVTATAMPPGDLTLSGRVYDATVGPSQGISGAIVSAIMCVPRPYRTMSEADGSYSLLLPALYLTQCASITLEAQAAGYQTLSLMIAVTDLRAQPVRDLALIPLPTPTATASPTPTRVVLYLPIIVRSSNADFGRANAAGAYARFTPVKAEAGEERSGNRAPPSTFGIALPIVVKRFVPGVELPTPTATLTEQLTPTPTPSVTPTATYMATPTLPASPTVPAEPTATETLTPGPTDTATPTPTETLTPVPTATPTVTPTPTPTVPNVRIDPTCCQFDAPGNDNEYLNEEYVCFKNWDNVAANLSGWQVQDEGRHVYTFPTFTLQGQARVKLRTGCGSDTFTDIYWCQSGAIWNNDGDTVYLYDAVGVLVNQYSY